MKKIIVLAMSLCLILGLSACSKEGSVSSNLKVTEVPSEIYSKKDIEEAMDVVKQSFSSEFSNCTLEAMSYGSDERVYEWKDYYHKEDKNLDYILIDVTFHTGSLDRSQTLNENSTYDWTCSLVKYDHGQWEVEDFGFL